MSARPMGRSVMDVIAGEIGVAVHGAWSHGFGVYDVVVLRPGGEHVHVLVDRDAGTWAVDDESPHAPWCRHADGDTPEVPGNPLVASRERVTA